MLICLWPVADSYGADSASAKRVLIIHSFQNLMRGFPEFEIRLRREIQSGLTAPVEFYTENLDSVLFPGEQHQRRAATYLGSKYAGRRIDLLVAVSYPALEFIYKYEEQLFPGTPIVFTLVHKRQAQSLSSRPDVTGVSNDVDLGKTLEVALHLQPDIRHVFVPLGTSELEQNLGERVRQSLGRFERQVEVHYLTDLPWDVMKERIGHLPPHSLVFYPTYPLARGGPHDNSNEPLAHICRSANAPVYAPYSNFMGLGIVGGYLVDFQDSGTRAGEIGRRILLGESPEDIPIELVSPQRDMFDGRQLRRWNIPDSRLPPGSEILYREPSIWESFKWHIVGTLSLLLIEVLLILALLATRARRKRAEQSLAERLRFEELVSGLSAAFVGLPACEVDKELKRGLERVGEFLEVDQVDLLECVDADRTLRFLGLWKGGGLNNLEDQLYHSAEYPWLAENLHRGRTVSFTKPCDLPGEADALRDYCEKRGVGSAAIVPTKLDESRSGAFAFFAIRSEISWSQQMLEQLRTVAEICANALRHKRAHQALLDSEALKNAILSSLDSNVVVLDAKGEIVAVNDAWTRLGREHGCIGDGGIGIGRNYLEICRRAASEGSGDAAEALAGIQGVVEGSLVDFHQEYRCDSNGEPQWYLMSVTALRASQAAIVVSHKKITSIRLAERDRRESEERFVRLSEAAPVMIWMSGEDKLCTYFNKTWMEFTGRAMEQELGNGWTNGVHRDDLKQCLEVYTQAFDSRRKFRMEYRLRRADGDYRWVADTGVPRSAPDGAFAGYIGSCIDITELKQAQVTLQAISSRMIQAQEDERRRIARELHDDISQRLALVAIDLEQLAQSPPRSEPELGEKVQALWSQTQDISNDIHRISHLLHPSKLEALGLVAAVGSLCQEAQKQRNLKVLFNSENIPKEIPQEVSLCLYRVVQESLQNLTKHSRSPRAEVRLTADADTILVQITDFGVGFDLEAARTHGGIGLASMRERLRAVGGIIEIDSHPGQGTRIEARAPLRKSSDQTEMNVVLVGTADTLH